MTTEKPKQLANQLFMLIKTAQIHDPSNRAFANPLQLFQSLISEMIEAEGPLALESVDLNLYLNEEKIRTDISTFETFRYLHEEFERKNIGGFRFLQAPSTTELAEFVRLLTRGTDPTGVSAEKLNAFLSDKEILSIEAIERKEKHSVATDQRTQNMYQKRRALKNYVKAIDVVKNAAGQISVGSTAEARKAKRIVYNLVDICLDEGFSFFGLANIKNYDEYTFNHSVNVCVISIAFGKNLGLSKKQIGELGLAGLYHDYGKLMIPKQILNKPGKFDPTEWEVMKTHPLESIKTLIKMGTFQESDIKKMIAAFEHHRNYDNSGYPQTGVKKKMNFYSKIVAIADAYDAMTTNRVYQRAMLPTVALKILMDNGGTKFDPNLVKAFVSTIGIYPVGTLLQMTDGSLALVTAIHQDPDKLALPIIRPVVGPGGQRLSQAPEIDLSRPEEANGLDIVQAARPEDYNININQVLFGEAMPTGASGASTN